MALVENLEETKCTALQIAEKVALARDTSDKLSRAREMYRQVAARGALLYFVIDSLSVLDRVYHYSMANFMKILQKGVQKPPYNPLGNSLVFNLKGAPVTGYYRSHTMI